MDLRSILAKVRSFLFHLAPVTPIKTDDALVVMIDALLSDATLFGWFEAKVDADDSGVLSMQVGPPEAVSLALSARSIDWSQLVALLPTLLAIVKLFRG